MTHPIPFAALDGKVGVMGVTGSGKSHTAIGLVELLLDAGRQVIVVDPTGAYNGLRTVFPIPIFGGRYGDVEIGEESGDAVARAIVDRDLSAIVDVSLLLKESHAAARRFMAAFVATLKNAPARARYLVMDEADEFMPENASGGVARLFGDLKWIVRRGRIEGWRMLMVTQRPQDIAKSVLTQCETMVIHQLTSPQDRKALLEWVKGTADAEQGRAVLDSMARLATGEAWVWSPRHNLLERVRMPANRSEDRSKTPDADDAPRAQLGFKEIDLEAMKAAFAAVAPTPVRSDPAAAYAAETVVGEALREREARIAELQAALSASKAREERFYESGKAAGIGIGLTRASAAIGALRIPEIAAESSPPGNADQQPSEAVVAIAPPQRKPQPAPFKRAAQGVTAGETEANMPPRWQRILDGIAWTRQLLGRDGVERNIVAWIAEISPKSSSYANDLGALRTRGLIDYPAQGEVALTDAGAEVAAWPAETPTKAALLEAISEKLEPRHRRLLYAVWNRKPETLTREELAELASVSATSSSFANDLGKLRTLGLIDYPGPGRVSLGRVLG